MAGCASDGLPLGAQMGQHESGLRAAEAQVPRVIAADYQKVKGPRSQLYKECIGAGRAAEGLRAAWQEQLKLCQKEIGFKYIRFHGLLQDEMGVYTETRDGTVRHNWQYVDQLYDALLAAGIRPFVEIGFMPSALASGNQTIFWWKANVSPPKSYEKWDSLITDLVAHWTERYGAEEVKNWYFEIWNEADYPAFFAPRDAGRRPQEYGELYQHTAAAIKKVSSAYRVGGPATSGTDWVGPFVKWTADEKAPLDFVSFHAYGLGNGPGGLDENGDQLHYVARNLHQPVDTVKSQRKAIDALGANAAKLPIHLTEWSVSYSSRDPVHDAYFSAPYILEQFKQADGSGGLASMSYWVFTDIFEENGPGTTPFHGGFGLLTVQGIKKPSYFAYQFLSNLGSTELVNEDSRSWVCRDDHGGLQVLLWDLTDTTGGQANQLYFREPRPPGEKGHVSVKLSHVPAGSYDLSIREVGYKKNDAYTAWMEMGKPGALTRENERALKAAAAGVPQIIKEIRIGNDGRFEQWFPLRENDVLLLTLTRRQRAL